MPRIVYYAAMSADGFIAARDGGVGWLESFNSPELGYEEFLSGVGAVVLGRATYEQSLMFGPWPYPRRIGVVVSSRPITDLPEGIRIIGAPELAAAIGDLAARSKGDVWIVGGGRTARACLDAGLIDEVELYVVPCLLGDGIGAFERRDAKASLRLLDAHTFSNGVVRLRYATPRTA